MVIRIDRKIVDCSVESSAVTAPPIKAESRRGEPARPHELSGTTYRIDDPQSGYAVYVTINDIVLNPGTEHELVRPFELFINPEKGDETGWTGGLARVISAVFRRGGDLAFLVEELRAAGGEIAAMRTASPPVAELAVVLERHLRRIGLIRENGDSGARAPTKTGGAGTGGQPGRLAPLCRQCNTRAMIDIDGCLTCLNCGESRCG